MSKKINALRMIDDFFIIELKNGEEKKIEINELEKISFRVVKRNQIPPFSILISLLILNLICIQTIKFKIEGAFFITLFFTTIYHFYNKKYRLVMKLLNKEKYHYKISFRKKLEMKEKVILIRDIQYKHNFK